MYVFVINSSSVTSLRYKSTVDHSWTDVGNTDDTGALEVYKKMFSFCFATTHFSSTLSTSILRLIFFLFKLCLCVFVHVCAGTLGGQRRASDSMELELQAVVSCRMWASGGKLRSSKRAVPTLPCVAISLAPYFQQKWNIVFGL